MPGSVPRREPLHRVGFHTVERVESIDIGSFVVVVTMARGAGASHLGPPSLARYVRFCQVPDRPIFP